MRLAVSFLFLLMVLLTHAFSAASENVPPQRSLLRLASTSGEETDERGRARVLTTKVPTAGKASSALAAQRLRLRGWQYGRLLLDEYIGVEPPLVVGSRVSTPSRVDSGTWVYDFNSAFCVWK